MHQLLRDFRKLYQTINHEPTKNCTKNDFLNKNENKSINMCKHNILGNLDHIQTALFLSDNPYEQDEL